MTYKRNSAGLLEGVKYEYDKGGSIDWRAMIEPEHLYPNKSWFEMRNQPMPTSIEGLEDNQLLIKLSGIKELARLRGFRSLRYDVIKCDLDHVSIKCCIDWIPNFENPDQEKGSPFSDIHFEDVANATLNNTNSFAQKFLETIAANRAFVRCVRNFLNVHIVGADEIDSSNGTPPSVVQAGNKKKFSPLNVLMDKTGLSGEDFSTFKDILRSLWKGGQYKNEKAADWESWEDVPKKEIMKLLNIL
jgi:hypothetical protein|tara:strand:+ start:3257 stop:3991 length:735 start_codon:yes stop_codon:yes gene_type:complete